MTTCPFRKFYYWREIRPDQSSYPINVFTSNPVASSFDRKMRMYYDINILLNKSELYTQFSSRGLCSSCGNIAYNCSTADNAHLLLQPSCSFLSPFLLLL